MAIRLEKLDGSIPVLGKTGKDFAAATIAWCDGPEDIYQSFKAGKFTGWDMGGGWAGASAGEAFRKGAEGDTKYVPLVENMLDKVEAALADVNAGATIMDNSVVGFMPDVPSAIMGVPESMITLEETSSDRAPITIWVNTTMGANWNAEQIAPRGAAVAALLMKLQAVRPVRLIGVTCYGANGPRPSCYVVYPIASAPLSLAQISYVFCETGWTRQMYSMMDGREPFNGNGHWDQILFGGFRRDTASPKYHKHMIALLGGDVEHDIYIPPLMNEDGMGNDAVKWVADKIKHYLKDAEATAL